VSGLSRWFGDMVEVVLYMKGGEKRHLREVGPEDHV
jgi:hypothetical protein